MIVLDTSAAIELLLALPLSHAVHEHIEAAEWQLAAPQLLIVEVHQVLRRRVAAGYTSLSDADEARLVLSELDVHFYDHGLLADRIWELRANLTAYDASYVALAEGLDAELLTSDARLARSPGHGARCVLVG